jgi:hypothetical protein
MVELAHKRKPAKLLISTYPERRGTNPKGRDAYFSFSGTKVAIKSKKG